ncbi:MAG: sugar kinase [Pseudomonadota bacterium]
MTRICCIGEAMIEVQADVVPGRAMLGFAGDTLNTAIYMARVLSPGHTVDYITAVGTDPYSDQMLAFIESHGVGTELIARMTTHHPGLYSIQVDNRGERSFTYWRGQSAARQMFSPHGGVALQKLNAFDIVYVSGITLAILNEEARGELLDWIELFRAEGGLFAFDSNYRAKLWESRSAAQAICAEAWQLCDIALPSVDDEADLFEESENEIMNRFAGYTASLGALKRGARGPAPINWRSEEELTFQPADTVVDTTAAGDSFSGGYIGALVNTNSHQHAMSTAHALSRQVVGHRGAIVPTDVRHTDQ